MEYFSTSQIKDLAQRLIRLTENKKVTWKSTDADPDTFTAVIKDKGFAIKPRDDDGMAPHLFTVYAGIGGKEPKILQTIDTAIGDVEMADAMDDLYLAVQRTTLKVDEVAAEVFLALDELEG